MMTMHEWTLISNLIHLYDRPNTFQSIDFMLQEQMKLPMKLRWKLSSSANIMFASAICIETIVQQSPDIRTLSIPARHRLVKNNIIQVGGFNSMIVDKHFGLSENQDLTTAFENLFGSEGVAQVIWLPKKMDGNIMLMKIMLFIMFFSSNFSIVRFDPTDDLRTIPSSLELSRIQDTYVTMMWKYMRYRFGQSEAVLRYSSMIGTILGLYRLYEVVEKMEVFQYMLSQMTTKMENLILINGQNS